MSRHPRTAVNPMVPAPRRRPKPNRSKCAATGKVRFRDAREADAAGVRHTNRESHVPLPGVQRMAPDQLGVRWLTRSGAMSHGLAA